MKIKPINEMFQTPKFFQNLDKIYCGIKIEFYGLTTSMICVKNLLVIMKKAQDNFLKIKCCFLTNLIVI